MMHLFDEMRAIRGLEDTAVISSAIFPFLHPHHTSRDTQEFGANRRQGDEGRCAEKAKTVALWRWRSFARSVSSRDRGGMAYWRARLIPNQKVGTSNLPVPTFLPNLMSSFRRGKNAIGKQRASHQLWHRWRKIKPCWRRRPVK